MARRNDARGPADSARVNADGDDLPAGDFRGWLRDFEQALDTGQDMNVPCNGCTACCRSSQFVHIEPDEHDALAHSPRELLVVAPRMPPGHVVLGYNERGECPMLVDDRCSIYEHRPRACRTYDCRVFAATDVSVDATKPAIAARVNRWRFRHEDAQAERAQVAVRDAAAFISRNAAALPESVRPRTSAQHAVAAVQAHRVFVREPGAESRTGDAPDIAAVAGALARRRPN